VTVAIGPESVTVVVEMTINVGAAVGCAFSVVVTTSEIGVGGAPVLEQYET